MKPCRTLHCPDCLHPRSAAGVAEQAGTDKPGGATSDQYLVARAAAMRVLGFLLAAAALAAGGAVTDRHRGWVDNAKKFKTKSLLSTRI